MNTKDLLESKAHRENEALEYLLQENERLETTLATVQLKEQKYHEDTLSIAAASENLGQKNVELERSRLELSGLEDDIRRAEKKLAGLRDASKDKEDVITKIHEHEASLLKTLQQLREERDKVGDAESNAKATSLEVLDEGRCHDRAYHELLETLHVANLDQKALLEEQSLQIHQLQLEQVGLKEAEGIATETLSEAMQQLKEQENEKPQVDADYEASLRAKEELFNAVSSREEHLRELSKERDSLRISVISSRLERLQALDTRSQEALDAMLERQRNTKSELSVLNKKLEDLHKYESKIRQAPDIGTLSVAAQARFLPKFSERLARCVQEQTCEFQIKENKKKAVLEELRNSKRLHLKEETRNKVVLEWKRKLDEVNTRIQRLNTDTEEFPDEQRKQYKGKAEKKDRTTKARSKKDDVGAPPTLRIGQPSPSLSRLTDSNDGYSSPRTFLASRKGAVSSRYTKLTRSTNQRDKEEHDSTTNDEQSESKATKARPFSWGKQPPNTADMVDWFQDW